MLIQFCYFQPLEAEHNCDHHVVQIGRLLQGDPRLKQGGHPNRQIPTAATTSARTVRLQHLLHPDHHNKFRSAQVLRL